MMGFLLGIYRGYNGDTVVSGDIVGYSAIHETQYSSPNI